ncbi:MAG: MATE family efflux transporter [Pseudomonadota bacterium]
MTERTRAFTVTHKAVLAIAVPMTVANLSTPLLGLVDTAVIGRLGSAALIGAVAVGAVFFDFLFGALHFLRIGTVGLTAQALGARDETEQRAVLIRALLLAVAAGLLLIALKGPLTWAAFAFIDASAEVTTAAATYIDLRLWSAPVALANLVIVGWFLGLGRATTALVLQVLLNGTNVVLNIAFVLGLGWGVWGLALGTVLAEIVTLMVSLVLAGRMLGWRLDVSRARILDAARLKRLMAVNRDIMIRTLALTFAFATFARAGAQAGDVALAANAILMNLFLFTAHFLDGAAGAAEQLGGRSVGARDRAGLRRTLALTNLWGTGTAVVLALVLLLLGPAIVDLLTTAPAVREAAKAFLPWAALTPLTGTLAFQLDGLYIGATWTEAMRDMMLIALALYLALVWLLSAGGVFDLGNTGLWIALHAFLLLRGATLLWLYPRMEARTFASSRPV